MSTSTSATSTSAENETETETIEVTIPEQKVITIPLFLKKLWKMVNDSNHDDVIGWNSTGDGFIIFDQMRFVTELLPQYFKHNNLSSFIRQLNFYDFHKVANIDKNEMEFAHACFLKDLPETLPYITRKVPNVKSKLTNNIQQENVAQLVNGVRELKSKHSQIDTELKMLKQENAALWSEINSLRVKYSKQTKIINKLIHFLISYMHSQQNSFAKSNIAGNRKINQQHLNNSPQLLQIGYHKAPVSVKEATTSKVAPRTVTITTPLSNTSRQTLLNKKDFGINYTDDVVEPVKLTSRKYPVSTVPSYSYVTEVDSSYDVCSPKQQDNSTQTASSPCPIEEIVSDSDPTLEETSVYTVKFPKTKSKLGKQKIITINQPVRRNATNVNIISKQPVISQNIPKLVLISPKQSPVKRKSSTSDSLITPSPPKVVKTTQRGKAKHITQPSVQKTEVFTKPKKVKEIATGIKNTNIGSTNRAIKKEDTLPEPSPVKPEVVLDDLFSEIADSGGGNMSGTLTNLQSTSFEDPVCISVNTQLPDNILETQAETSLPEVQTEEALKGDDYQDIPDFIDTSTDFFPTLSSETDKSYPSTSEAMFSSIPNSDTQANTFGNDSLLDAELDNYPEEMLSNLASNIPEVHSPSKELLKFNIIENPKENLGLYLDNTQIQLDNIQDLLNDLKSGELLDLWNCYNVDEDNEDTDNTLDKNTSQLELKK